MLLSSRGPEIKGQKNSQPIHKTKQTTTKRRNCFKEDTMCLNHRLTRVSVSVSPRANQISSRHVSVNKKQYTQTKLSKIVGLVKFYRTEKLCVCVVV